MAKSKQGSAWAKAQRKEAESQPDQRITPGKAYKLVNLTGHKVEFLVDDGEQPCRVLIMGNLPKALANQRKTYLGSIAVEGQKGLIPVYRTRETDVINLPEPERGVLYIVSGPVLRALNGSRPDVLSPSELVRSVRDKNVDGARSLELL